MSLLKDIICRICLDTVPVGYSIFAQNIHEKIEQITSSKIFSEDHLPQELCGKCIINVMFCSNFRNKIIENSNILRALYLRDGNFHELLKNGSIPLKQEPNSISNSEDVQEKKDENLEFVATNCDNVTETNTIKKSPSPQRADDFEDEMDNLSLIICKINNEKPYMYRCKVCNVDMQGNREKNKHKLKHVKKTCDICKITIRADNMSHHKRLHTLGPQVCHICGSTHKSSSSLRIHIFNKHKPNKKLYKCEDCNLTFNYSSQLAYHNRKIHTGDRPHQCDYCGKRFLRLDYVRHHINTVHLKLRPFVCNFCKKGFSSKNALSVHIRQHTNESPYFCDICGERFRQKVSLKTHTKSQHKIIGKPILETSSDVRTSPKL